MQNSPFANNLRKARDHWGLTQHQVAIKLKIDRKRYQAYETGRAQPPMAILACMCKLFQVKDVPAFLDQETFSM